MPITGKIRLILQVAIGRLLSIAIRYATSLRGEIDVIWRIIANKVTWLEADSLQVDIENRREVQQASRQVAKFWVRSLYERIEPQRGSGFGNGFTGRSCSGELT